MRATHTARTRGRPPCCLFVFVLCASSFILTILRPDTHFLNYNKKRPPSPPRVCTNVGARGARPARHPFSGVPHLVRRVARAPEAVDSSFKPRYPVIIILSWRGRTGKPVAPPRSQRSFRLRLPQRL